MPPESSHVQRVRILYKTILRLHRGLPEGLQTIGSNYARDEFKRHKNCNSLEANIFLNEWTNYAMNLSQQLGIRGPKTATHLGTDLSPEQIAALNDEQVRQLYELLQSTTLSNEESTRT